jgi:hypothetical protein
MAVARTVLDELQDAARNFWQAVAELAVTVFDDHPEDTDLVVVDDLMEHVSELQSAADAVRRAADCQPLNVAFLGLIHDNADEAVAIYLGKLLGYRATYELRLAARRRDNEWRSWAAGVEQALARCAEPLEHLRTAVRASWRAGPHQLAGDTHRNASTGGNHGY